ncbi:MAG TPA: hypothetical protein VK879_21135 [Candidatus Sulfomarinibacteraceae bacterium]|nr:hypothetical protein [Candidatus Sulfomarinibacteraceae bacterium]
MGNDALLDLLSAHADALNQGQESVGRLLRSYPALPPGARPMLALAWQLKQTLVPVPVPPSFRAELRRQLHTAAGEGRPAPMVVSTGGRWRPLWMGAAALGSLLPLLGLLLFWRRRQRTHPLAGAT